ncbi:hypothetical protein [Sphingobacterium luzhongxinii]|uniref:hypothetical protein n=1 Tax=Sphingobacterium luzhongxinii TaxID=2654181 RepID=UPI0013DAF15D|nr:hypothetical protein [Sphingobacterium sp. xlx-73]
MIPEVERNILEKIDYANKYLLIRKKYTEDHSSVWLYKKSDLMQVFKNLGLNVKYVREGACEVEQLYKNYTFKYSFVVSKNNFSIYLYIYIDGDLVEDRVSNTGSLLRYLPYNLELAENLNTGGLVLDSFPKMENYIKDHLVLLKFFVDEYKLIL